MADGRTRSNHDDDDDDVYLTIDELAIYSHLSTRTLKRYLRDPEHPLPSHHLRPAGKARGRLLFRKDEFDAWVRSFDPTPAVPAATPAVDVSWVRRAFRSKD